MTTAAWKAMTIEQLANEIIEWGGTNPRNRNHAEIHEACEILAEKSAAKWSK